MICTWLNCVFCTLSRKRGVPADTIKGVLFFKISKKDPHRKTKAEKIFCFIHTRHQTSVVCIAAMEKGRGVPTKGVSFFKIWEREVCFPKFEKRSLLLQKLWTVWENSMSVVILFASLVWKGRGERAYSDGVSHKRRFVFLKKGQNISSIYRYKLCAFETLLTR